MHKKQLKTFTLINFRVLLNASQSMIECSASNTVGYTLCIILNIWCICICTTHTHTHSFLVFIFQGFVFSPRSTLNLVVSSLSLLVLLFCSLLTSIWYKLRYRITRSVTSRDWGGTHAVERASRWEDKISKRK